MTMKVLVDSNVLIAASVHVVSAEDFRSPIKHRFFDDAMHLVGLLKKHIGKRIGIVTSTIEDEVHAAFRDAVLNTLRECRPKFTQKEAFDLASFILNKCEDRLSSTLSVMMREPLLPQHGAQWLTKVNEMYDELTKRAQETNVQDLAYKKAGGSSKKFQNTAYEAILADEQNRFKQLKRLLSKSVGTTDRQILAEAAYLQNYYKQLGTVRLYLASTDLAFSPTGREYSSCMVTDEIRKRFGVICHWPSEVAKELERELH